MAYFEDTMYNPGNSSEVDAANETVEGRVNNLLKQDNKGNYTNQVVRQAADRQLQAFNSRGLLNSSMAMQGAQEAVISKATDIASQDAKVYYDNRRANLDQAFSVRKSYQDAVKDITTNYQRQIDTINASSMTPEDKNVAIAQAGAMRDGELTFQNSLFSKMPDWRNEWLSAAVPTAGMDLSKVNNRDTLSNIANDPGQTEAMRSQALDRMRALDGGAGGTNGSSGPALPDGIPSAGDASNGGQYPMYSSSGQYINWQAGGVQDVFGQVGTLKDAYEAYLRYNNTYNLGYTMSPSEWYASTQNRPPVETA